MFLTCTVVTICCIYPQPCTISQLHCSPRGLRSHCKAFPAHALRSIEHFNEVMGIFYSHLHQSTLDDVSHWEYGLRHCYSFGWHRNGEPVPSIVSSAFFSKGLKLFSPPNWKWWACHFVGRRAFNCECGALTTCTSLCATELQVVLLICLWRAASMLCQSLSCAQGCRASLHGGECFCLEGLKINSADNRSCVGEYLVMAIHVLWYIH